MLDEMGAFLAVDAAHVRDDRLVFLPQQQPVTQGIFVRILPLDRAGGVVLWDQDIDLRIPYVVVDAVEDTAELALLEVGACAPAPSPDRCGSPPRRLWWHRGDEIRVNDAALSDGRFALPRAIAAAMRTTKSHPFLDKRQRAPSRFRAQRHTEVRP